MNAEQLLQNFDRIAESPGSIAHLRRFILDLAVRGKLVEQDPNDEPASELLKRIQIEKARLEKEGEIKKQKPLPPISVDNEPFSIPKNWCWARLDGLTSYIQRGKSPKYAIHDGFPVISQKCIQWDGLDLSKARLVTKESIESYEKIRFLQNRDLLWNSTGTGTIGRIIKLENPQEKLICDSHVTVVRCINVNSEFIRTWLRSDNVYGAIEGKATGATNQIELTAQMAINQVVPLPPLTEQHRIVAKVDELMGLCDRLEAAQKDRESQRDRLVASSLHYLNQATAPAEFRDRAQFYFDRLPKLTTRSEHIKQLRQTILNLAVCGKLVPQDPNDEPASELLKQIKAAKVRLVNEEKIKAQKKEPQIIEDKIPYILPNTWTWISFAELIYHSDAGISPKTESFAKSGDNWGVMKVSAVSWDKFNPEENKQLFPEAKFPDSAKVLTGDFLISRANTSELVAKCVIVESQPKNLILSDKIVRLHIMDHCEKRFLYFVNNYALYARSYYAIEASGTSDSMKNVSRSVIYALPIPLPPLAEQRRIVAKVDELMGLCDRLEAQIDITETDSHRLLESLLYEAL